MILAGPLLRGATVLQLAQTLLQRTSTSECEVTKLACFKSSIVPAVMFTSQRINDKHLKSDFDSWQPFRHQNDMSYELGSHNRRTPRIDGFKQRGNFATWLVGFKASANA